MSQFTKKAIRETFIQLLNRYPLDKITVKDIVEECGVNRNTFYYYYQDIYALVDDVFLAESEKVINTDTVYDTIEESMSASMEFAMKNRKLIYHVYNSVGREKVETYLYQVTDRLIVGYIDKESEGLKVLEQDKKLISDFYKFAFVGMIMQWIAGGMEENAEELIPNILRNFYGTVRLALENAAQ